MFLSEDQKLSLLSNISNKLYETHSISSYEYELFNLIKREENNSYEVNLVKKIGEENSSNEEKIENRITKDKIKTNIEKIMSYIKDKKDFEFISDFFITESNPHLIDNVLEIKNEKSGGFEFEEIDDDFLNYFSKNNLSDINSIMEFNKKIKQNKFSELDEQLDLTLINTKKIRSKEDLILDDIKKSEIFNKKKDNDDNINNKEEMEKEMEEEINREIFGYTKKMKESARNVGVQLKKDNKVLYGIENLQDVVGEKAKKEFSRLKKFNHSLKFGFCKLIVYVIIVFGTFFATLFICSFVPKFV